MRARRLVTMGGFAALTAVLALTGLAAGAANDVPLVSRAAGAAGAVGDGDSVFPSISADGRYVAFVSNADNLDGDSDDAVADVFVRDTQTNTTTLVSRATGAAGAVGDGGSFSSSISADGRYVAFASDADNLDADSNDDYEDIFVRDTQTNTTTLVSRAAGAAGAVGDQNSSRPSISDDGRHVAFESEADNLNFSGDDAVEDIFVRDTQMNTTTLVSRASGALANAVGDEDSIRPSISDDGRHVAFESDADNLDLPSNDMVRDVFVRDTQNITTTLVSRDTGSFGQVNNGGEGNQSSFRASISADGRYVAFDSDAGNIDDDSLDTVGDAFVRDTQTNTTTLVSRAAGAAGVVGDGDSFDSSISADGRYVALDSDADNLDPDSYDLVTDTFVRDTQTNTTTLVSRAAGATGVVGDLDSFEPSISANGRYVAFASDADNLDLDSTDGIADVFRRELFDLPAPLPPPAAAPPRKCKKGFKLQKVKTKSGKKKKKCVRKKKKKKKKR